jgi:hypothetical protein
MLSTSFKKIAIYKHEKILRKVKLINIIDLKKMFSIIYLKHF